MKNIEQSLQSISEEGNMSLHNRQFSLAQIALFSANLMENSLEAPSYRGRTGTLRTFIDWVKNTLIPWLQNLFASTLSMLNQMTKIDEWSLSGEFKIFPGMAKTAMEIKFKP